MSTLRLFLPGILILGCACRPVGPSAPHPAAPGATSASPASSQAVEGTVQGVLRQVGTDPHLEVVVSGTSEAFGKGDYRVTGPLQKEISGLPLGPITVKGKLQEVKMGFAGSSGRSRTWLVVDVVSYTR